jgi:hypothetical protein
MTFNKTIRVTTLTLSALLVLALAFVIAGGSVHAKQKVYKSGDFRYTVNKKGSATITAYKGTDTKVEIPNAIKNHMVRTIGKNAFKNKSSIKKVILPYGLWTIESGAFDSCYEMKTKLPAALTTIGEKAFYECENLSKMKLPSSLKNIGDYAFYECGMKKVTLPANVKKVGEYAFGGAEKVTLGKSFSSWNWKSFASDHDVLAIKEIKTAKKSKYYSVKKGVLYNKNKTHLVFANCADKAKVSLPKSVIVIDPEAVVSCELKKLKLNDGLETISDNAFVDVQGISSISVPSTVNFIGRASLDTSAEELVLETRLLTKNKIRGCLKDSAIKTISVQVGSESSNKTYIKKYKKIFTKKITKTENDLVFQ